MNEHKCESRLKVKYINNKLFLNTFTYIGLINTLSIGDKKINTSQPQ